MNGNGHHAEGGKRTFAVKVGLAQMLKGGVIMDVTTADEVSLFSCAFSPAPA